MKSPILVLLLIPSFLHAWDCCRKETNIRPYVHVDQIDTTNTPQVPAEATHNTVVTPPFCKQHLFLKKDI